MYQRVTDGIAVAITALCIASNAAALQKPHPQEKVGVALG